MIFLFNFSELAITLAPYYELWFFLKLAFALFWGGGIFGVISLEVISNLYKLHTK